MLQYISKKQKLITLVSRKLEIKSLVNGSTLMLARLLQAPINCLQSNAKASPLSLIVRSEMLMIIKLRTQDGLKTNGPSAERRSPGLKSPAVITTRIL